MSDKDLLDDYLDGDSDLSGLYAASKDESAPPSQAVDARLMAAAKRELGSTPQPVRRPGIRRWAVPFSVAATLMLTTTLYLTNQGQLNNLPSPSSIPTDSTATEASDHDSAGLTESDAINAPAMMRDQPARSEMKKQTTPGAEPGAQAAPKTQPRVQLGTSSEAAREISPRLKARQDQSSLDRARQSITPQEMAPGAPLSRSATLKDLAPAAPVFKSEAINIEMEMDKGIEQHDFTASPRAAKSAPERRSLEALAAPVTADADPAVDTDVRATAESWLNHILTLQEQGKRERAQNEFDAFIRHHAAYPIPDSLKPLDRR